jgi:preprotein translocase subunit SecE
VCALFLVALAQAATPVVEKSDFEKFFDNITNTVLNFVDTINKEIKKVVGPIQAQATWLAYQAIVMAFCTYGVKGYGASMMPSLTTD